MLSATTIAAESADSDCVLLLSPGAIMFCEQHAVESKDTRPCTTEAGRHTWIKYQTAWQGQGMAGAGEVGGALVHDVDDVLVPGGLSVQGEKYRGVLLSSGCLTLATRSSLSLHTPHER